MQQIQILNTDKHVRTIYHLSDIHIRLYHRLEDEYAYVFQQMYDLLAKETPKEDCLIVLTGDILHSKNDLSPECIIITLRFLNTLSSYCPTLLIAGNHDALLNNLDRTDSLTAILSENHNPHLHYLKHSGFYRYGNILFGVSSLLDGKITKMEIKDDCPLTKIALYHGGVGKFSTNKGFVMEGISLHTFDGYDMVMLGDIHLHQYLDSKKRIAYAGSMIAQNFGETDALHGVLKWNVQTCSSSFIILDNPFRYCEALLTKNGMFSMDGKQVEIADAILPEKCRLKLMIHGKKTDKDIAMIVQLQKKFPHIHIHEQVVSISDDNHQMITNNLGTNTMNEILDEYFSTLPHDYAQFKDIVIGYFKDHSAIQLDTTMTHFELLCVEFSYMFGYGPDVKLDFSRFDKHQTIGVFGENSSGKSTLVEIILFLLYGHITRYKHGASVPQEVIHFQQDKSWGMVRFRSHNITYEVRKKMTRNKTTGKIRVDEKLFRLDNHGNAVDLSEEHRKKTDKFVISQIGTSSQFLFTNIFLQSNELSFRSMTPKDRKEFLYHILGLSQLEAHYESHLAQSKINQSNLLLVEKELQSLTITPSDIHHLETVILSLTQEEETIMRQLELIKKQIRDILKQKKHCPISSLDDLTRRIHDTRLKISQTQTQSSSSSHPLILHDDTVNLEEEKRNIWDSLEALYKQLRHTPTPIFHPYYTQYPHHPTPQDLECFRQDIHDKFMALYTPPPFDFMDQKDKLLSSLFPIDDECQTTISKTQSKDLDMLKTNLIKQETRMHQLENEWRGPWDEYKVMSRLDFTNGCNSCTLNRNILHDCLLRTEETRQKKQQWETLQTETETMRKDIIQMEHAQKLFHNRSVRRKLKKIKQQQDQDAMANVWKQIQQTFLQQRIQNDIHIQKNKLEMVEGKLAVKELSDLETWCSHYHENIKMDKQIAALEHQESSLQQHLHNIMSDRMQKEQQHVFFQKQYEIKLSKESEHQKILEENHVLKKLLHLTHRDGLPMFFLEKVLPTIEQRVNELLSPFLANKRVVLRKKDNMDILLSVMSPHNGAETVYMGGMEGFMVDASMKEVLAEISVQCKSNIFVIDEGISALDKKHMENLDQFFHFLEERHPHVFVISHLNEAQHIVNHSLHVIKQDGYSQLEYN